MSVEVTATKDGFYGGNFIREGSDFTLDSVHYKDKEGNKKVLSEADQLSKVWMRRKQGKPALDKS